MSSPVPHPLVSVVVRGSLVLVLLLDAALGLALIFVSPDTDYAPWPILAWRLQLLSGAAVISMLVAVAAWAAHDRWRPAQGAPPIGGRFASLPLAGLPVLAFALMCGSFADLADAGSATMAGRVLRLGVRTAMDGDGALYLYDCGKVGVMCTRCASEPRQSWQAAGEAPHLVERDGGVTIQGASENLLLDCLRAR